MRVNVLFSIVLIIISFGLCALYFTLFHEEIFMWFSEDYAEISRGDYSKTIENDLTRYYYESFGFEEKEAHSEPQPTYASFITIPETSHERIYFEQLDMGFSIELFSDFSISTSSQGIVFTSAYASLLVSDTLNMSIPSQWNELSEYSVEDHDAYVLRTYQSFDNERIYYTFIQNDFSFVIKTTLTHETSFKEIFPIITSFKIL